jgi:hypothetical protein
MIATLTFTLPEEREDFERACQSSSAFITLWDLDQYLRGLVKYGINESKFGGSQENPECVMRNEETLTAATVMTSRIREVLHELMKENNVNLE